MREGEGERENGGDRDGVCLFLFVYFVGVVGILFCVYELDVYFGYLWWGFCICCVCCLVFFRYIYFYLVVNF